MYQLIDMAILIAQKSGNRPQYIRIIIMLIVNYIRKT